LLAPIALFVYNRLDHTLQTIASLQKNILAEKSDLYVFSDGAKSEEGEKKVKVVREYIKNISGFKSLSIIERSSNFGLANSIISGVTQLSNEFGKVIVVEDDLVTSPYFLKYMNDGLEIYEKNEEVISIHGYIYPVRQKLPETFFLRGADCWGWATWKRGWDLFEPNGRKLLEELESKGLENEFNFNGNFDYIKMLKSQINGLNNSWAIRWYASAFLKNKLTLYPGKSFVLNIGNDESGTHCQKTEVYTGEINNEPIKVGDIDILESSAHRTIIAEYFKVNKTSFFKRIINKIGRLKKKCFNEQAI
jgi:hypothetical protein